MKQGYPRKHANGTNDQRHTITLEWCGYPDPRFVYRYCGNFISSHAKQGGADKAGREYRMVRFNHYKSGTAMLNRCLGSVMYYTLERVRNNGAQSDYLHHLCSTN